MAADRLYNFSLLLNRLSENICEQDFKKIKLTCVCCKYISHSQRDNIKDAFDLFYVLLEKDFFPMDGVELKKLIECCGNKLYLLKDIDEFLKGESTPKAEVEVDLHLKRSFSKLIVDLAENIVTDSEDFKNLILLCRNNYIPETKMKEIKSPHDLFGELLRRGVVSHLPDGLTTLKTLIEDSVDGNMKLIELITKFEIDSQNTPSSSSSSSPSSSVSSSPSSSSSPVSSSSSSSSSPDSSSPSSSPSTQTKLIHKNTDGDLDMIELIKQFETLSVSTSVSSSSTQTIMAAKDCNCIYRNPDLPSSTILTLTWDIKDRFFYLFNPTIDSLSISLTWKWNSMDGDNSRIINPHRNNTQHFSPLTIINNFKSFLSGKKDLDLRGFSERDLLNLDYLKNSFKSVNDIFNLRGNPNEGPSSLDNFVVTFNETMKNIDENPDGTFLCPNILTREIDLRDFGDFCGGDEGELLLVISEFSLVYLWELEDDSEFLREKERMLGDFRERLRQRSKQKRRSKRKRKKVTE